MLRIVATLSVLFFLAYGSSLLTKTVHAASPQQIDNKSEHLAIVGAQIITMDGSLNNAPIENGTIIVHDGRIVEVGINIAVPDGATVVNAEGLTAVPGLVDMHVHYWSELEGALFLANGVTTVRNLWGTLQTERLDRGAEALDFPGPRVYSPGPLTDGPEPIWGEASLVVENVEQAIGAVRAQKAVGFSAVKLYEKLTPEIYKASVNEAKRLKMQVYTHTPGQMTVVDVIKLKPDSLEHFDDAEEFLVPEGFTPPDGKMKYLSQWAAADEDKMRELAQLFAENNVANSVTLAVISGRYQTILDLEDWLASPVAEYVDSGLLDWWGSTAARTEPSLDQELVTTAREKQLTFLKILHDAGAPLLIGTDMPNPFIVAGFSLHDEIDDFVEAGLSNREVLQMATKGAAEFLKLEDEFGSIAKGLRADILLVKGDPLQDLSLLRKPEWVIAQGQAHNKDKLAQMLSNVRAEIAKTYESSENEE